MLIRYSLALALGLNNFYFLYLILSPLTIYICYFIFNVFFNASLSGNLITVNNIPVVLIDACIAIPAYYLLLCLAFLTPMTIRKRVLLIVFSFSSFLVLNIARIIFLVLISKYEIFRIAHLFFWYGLSTFFVVLIWFAGAKIFKIKEIPVYSDLKYLREKIN